MKRYIRSDSSDLANYKGYNKYIEVVEGMIDQGDDIDDVIDYIQNLYQEGKIENYEKNMLRRDARNRAYDREQENMTEDDLAEYYGQEPGTYNVSAFGGDEYMEPAAAPRTFRDPGKAIEQWCKYQQKYPMNAMITGYRGADEQRLRDWTIEHEDQLAQWCEEYKVPYKVEWLLDICHKPVKLPVSKAPDQLSPFSLG